MRGSRRRQVRKEVGWLMFLWRHFRHRAKHCGRSESSWIPPVLAKRIRSLATKHLIAGGGRWTEPRDPSKFHPNYIRTLRRQGDPRVRKSHAHI